MKVTSKGQMTLPVEIRRDLTLNKDDYLYVTKVGKLIVMKKVDGLSLDEISSILERFAKEKAMTKKVLGRDIEEARERLLRERHVEATRST